VVDGVEDLVWNTVPWTAAKNGAGPTASFKTLWTEKRLYVLADIKDATNNAGDSLSVYLDCGNRSASVQMPDVVRASFTRKATGPAGTEVKAIETAGDWRLEASLPFPAAAASGSKVGFDIRAGDAAKTAAVTSWNDTTHSQDENAAKYGTLTLTDAVRLAQAAPGTPKVDAAIEGLWNTAKAIQTDVAAKGSMSASAKVRMLWDTKFLYVLYEVTDPLLNKDSVNAYEQDSVEVFIDENNAKSTEYTADDGQYRVGYENAQSFGSNGKDARFASAARRTETGYVVEAAVPLKTVQGAAGLSIGFDAQVNDADASGRRVSIIKWNDPTDNSYRNTSGFGCLVFAAN
jgi:endo-1,4-beta-xylanase